MCYKPSRRFIKRNAIWLIVQHSFQPIWLRYTKPWAAAGKPKPSSAMPGCKITEVFKLIQRLYHISNSLFATAGRAANINNNQSLQLAKKIPSLRSQSNPVIINTRNTAKLSVVLRRYIGNSGLPAALATRANHGFYGIPAL